MYGNVLNERRATTLIWLVTWQGMRCKCLLVQSLIAKTEL
jgi:hypothetical protein